MGAGFPYIAPMKAYQSKARRLILGDPQGRKSLREFLEQHPPTERRAMTLVEEPQAGTVVTSTGRYSARLVPTR